MAETMLTAATAVLLFLVAAVWTDFSPEKIYEGLPRIGQYFGKLLSIEPLAGADPVPVLAFGHVFGGVKEPQSIAYWFYRIDVYGTLLWQTVQMAIIATVMGFTAAFVLCFPATGTQMPLRVLVFFLRRRAPPRQARREAHQAHEGPGRVPRRVGRGPVQARALPLLIRERRGA